MFADDADIEGVVSASRMTKTRYLTVLRERKRTEFFGIDNATIEMDGEAASVHGILTVCLVAGRSWKVEGSLKLRKEGERWLIFETRVQTPRYLPRGFL